MSTKIYFVIIFILVLTLSIFGQRPPRGDGFPGRGVPPRGEGRPGDRMPPLGKPGSDQPGGHPNGDWIRPHDTNNNEILEADEFQHAIDRTFADLDRNNNGTIEGPETEFPPRPREGRMPGQGGRNFLPPFFFEAQFREGVTLNKSDFESIVRSVFNEMDKDRNGSLTLHEARKLPPKIGPRNSEMAPNARFIAAELRFGDKLVKGQPFSADILIEDTRRLFDGSTVTKQMHGATYRDIEGRTRREQPLEMVGGISIVGTDNKPQKLVFINDFNLKSQIFLDLNNKVARKSNLNTGQVPEPGQPEDAKTESLGTKEIEGVTVEGTRSTFEIPVGQIGNDKPIQVISERWFSRELQVLVMSRHLDPLAGEHIFKLTNIKRSEPSADMFLIPVGFKIDDRTTKMREE